MWTWIQQELGTGFEAQALALLADVGLKGMVLMALASLAASAMKRSTASARHLVYLLALGGLLFLPFVSLLVPMWQLPILPASEPPAVPAPRSLNAIPDTPTTGPAPAPKTAPMNVPTTPLPVEADKRAPVIATPTPAVPYVEESTPVDTSTPTRVAGWLLAAWLVMAFILLFPLLAGLGALRRMTRNATPFTGDALPQLTQELAHALELRRPVRLLRAPAGTMPMAAGLFRAIVFLPAEAETWSDEKRRAVLLHELAHVKRRDCLTHALALLAVSLHWFNPFAWLALRQLRVEREHACDDLVLTAGERPAEYAEVLLDVARSLRAGTLASAAAITMAKKSHLEGRLLAVLDEARKRTRMTRRAILGFALVGALLTAALSTLHVTRAESKAVVDHLTFSSGVEVTLLGVGPPRDDNTPPWKPDGTPLNDPPEIGPGSYMTPLHGDSRLVRQFYQRTTTPDDLPAGESVSIRYGGLTRHNIPAGDTTVVSVAHRMDEDASRVDIDVGVAAGAWEPLAQTIAENGAQGTRKGVTYNILVGKPFKRDDAYHFTLTHDVVDLDKRVVVYDSLGKMHYTPGTGTSPGSGGTHMGEYSLGEVAPEDVRAVELQVREFEWRTFKNIASGPVDKIPFSPAYETALASDTDGRVQIGGGDFGVSRVRRVDAANALKALQFPVFPDDTLHSARFPELAEGEWDCLLIDVDDNGSLGNKLMKCFDVVQFRVFDHRTRKLLWDSDWRYNEYPDRDKFSGGFLSGADGRVFVAKRDERWPDDIDVWFSVDLLNNGKYTHQMMSIEPNYASIAGGDTGRVRIDEIRAGSWNLSYSESGGKVTWIEQNPGSEASECSVVLRRTGTWTDGRINVRALDATGNEYWPQSIHFLDFERSALEVVTFPLAADRVHQLKFARLEDQVDFRRTFYFDGVTLPPAAAPPVENIEEAAEGTASFPPPTVTLSAHEFQKVGTPVTLRLDTAAEELDSSTSRITIRCDGEEVPWFSSEDSGVKIVLGADFPVSPRHTLKGLSAGKHRVSVLLHDVEVRPRSGADREPAAVYPTLKTNEVEFEVLPEIPADYFRPTMEDGWNSMLDNAFADIRVQDHNDRPVVLFLDWRNVESIERPFALAFDVAMEEQTSGTIHPVGRMTTDVWPNYFSPRQHISLTMDNDDARELFRKWSGKQVRLVLTPSPEAALEDPAIRSYYGEVHTTEWVVLKPELAWNMERILAPYGVDDVIRYGNTDAPFGLDDPPRYGTSGRTILIEDWGLTCKAILDEGAVVLDAESDTRIMPLKDIVLPGAALDYIEQHLQELDGSELREIAIAPDALNYIGVRAPSGEVGILLVDTNRFGEREIYRWQVPPSPSAQVRPGWLRLEFRAHELLARSGDYRTVLVRNNTRLLRVESDLTGVDQPEGDELLQIAISGGPGRPARYGQVATPNLGTRRELERTNGLTPGSEQITKEYILRRSWDGAHVGVPALVTPNSKMRASDVWRTWRSANDSRTIEYIDDYGWRFVAHGAGWSPRRPDEIRYPLLSLFESYRPNGTLYSRTELTEGRPDTTHFYAMNGITLDGQTRLAWDEQDGTASLMDYTWRTGKGQYHRYVGTPNGVIHEEEVLALVDGEFIVQERLHHAPDSEIQVFELDMDAIVGPLADFRQETREPDPAVTTDTRGRTRSTSFVPRDPAASDREGRDDISGYPRS